jgi:6-phosphofructokinase 1
MVANHPPDIGAVPLEDIVGKTKQVPLDCDLIETARSIGIMLGD